MKQRIMKIRDLIVSHSKIAFPIVLIAIVAITVSLALGAKNKKDAMSETEESSFVSEAGAENALEVPDVPLELNAYPEVNALINTYYNALANGDVEAIESITNVVDEMEKIKIQELGKYIEWYTAIDVYTKPGPEANSYFVFAYTKVKFNEFEEEVVGYQGFYVCSYEDGTLYLNEDIIPQEYIDYIAKIDDQEDITELHNKITVEYNDTMRANPDLLRYIEDMGNEIRTTTGLIIAAQEAGNDSQNTDTPQENTPVDNSNGTQEPVQEVTGPVYATATTTVNVRSSDSETADKLGKVSKGAKLEVLEQKANGWSKIKYEKKDGYIKSEFLKLEESAKGVETIGTVTATTNINVRASASETADKIGVLAGGESLSLVATENGWCKVVYNNQIGYVKSDYVQQN